MQPEVGQVWGTEDPATHSRVTAVTDGVVHFQMDGRECFDTLAEWCEWVKCGAVVIEQTAPPPSVGSVWGDPAKPETWRMVATVDQSRFRQWLWWQQFYKSHGDSSTMKEWSAWLAESGAVDITSIVTLEVNRRKTAGW